MRFVVPWLLLVCGAAAFDAHACKVASTYQRPDAFREYDEQHRQWIESTARRLATDADPQIAWAGLMLVSAADGKLPDAASLPPLPTTGAGRLMRYLACDEGKQCPDALTQWLAAEPDNAFVLALALGDDRRDDAEDEPTDALRDKLARATRYDDHYLAVQTLADTIAAGTDPTRPPSPPDYKPPPCSFLYDTSFSALLIIAAAETMVEAPEALLDGPPLDPALRLRLADLLLAAPGSLHASVVGAALGKRATTSPIDRERYCRIEARAYAQEDVAEWLLTSPDARQHGHLQRFHRALATRNLVDAIDAVAPQLPASHRPDPVDPAHVADCVAGRD